MFKIEDLRNRQIECQESSEQIIAKAEAEKRDLNDDERKEVKQLIQEFKNLEEQIELASTVQNNQQHLSQSMGRQTDPEPEPRQPQNKGDVDPVPPPANRQPARNGSGGPLILPNGLEGVRGKAGFKNFGEFAIAVKAMAHQSGGQIDPRIGAILNAPTTYGQESVGADGGVAVPPDFRTEIVTKVFGEESLAGRTDMANSSSNSFTVPKDETTPWQTTGGIQAYWEGEGQQKTQSKPALTDMTVKLNKLITLVPVTDELLEDAPGMANYLRRKAPEKMDFKLNYAILNGTGVGQPFGIIGSPATVVVEKETGQAADTILYENVLKMWSRLYGPYRQNAVWLINQSTEEQLSKMSLTIGTGGVPVYMPAGGVSGTPFATLFNRPLIPTQSTQPLGDKGDIILADLKQYLLVQKIGGIRSDVSIHLWFDYDVTAFRFVLRVGGQPWWKDPIEPREGTHTLGAFVVLEERA